jgi:hypothetical protein
MQRRWPVLYCERGDLSLWAEPLNTLSNLAFLLAALLAWRALRQAGLRDLWIVSQIGLTLAIFVGSSAFHAMPNRVTVLMDVIPIQLFMLSYLALALRRFLRFQWHVVAIGLAVFIGFAFGLQAVLPSPRLAAVSAYVAALAALVIVGLATVQRDHSTGIALLAAGGVFALSLAARQLDLPWCPVIPIGTHWLWHLLNGTVLGILLSAAIRHSFAR